MPGSQPAFGIVELEQDGGPHPNTIAVISADPLVAPVKYTGARHDLSAVRLLAPVIPRSKIVAMGRNWVGHAQETGNDVPTTPIVFIKPNTSVIGPEDSVVKPLECERLDYEGEMAIVIGKICRRVPLERAEDVIFGYTCANDVTARDLQNSEEQWTRAKGFDTFCPLGPWLVTDLSIGDAGNRRITTTLDGRTVQDDSTANMVHSVAEIVAFASGFTTLLPGDVLLTGTPAGIGPMLPGQRVTVEIEGLGALTNPVIDERSAA